MLNFTEEALQQARTSRNRVRNLLFELRHIERDLPPGETVAEAVESARAGFVAGLEDDLNVSEALAALFELVRSVNILVGQGAVGKEDSKRVVSFIREIDDKVLGCVTGEVRAKGAVEEKSEITGDADILEARLQELIDARQKARTAKDFKLADEIRRELLGAGIILEDVKDGPPRWKRVRPPKS